MANTKAAPTNSGTDIASQFYKPGAYWETTPLKLDPITLGSTAEFTNALLQLANPKLNPLPTIPYGKINKAASGMAASDIAAGLKAYHDQQSYLLGIGAAQARAISQAATGAAKLTTPWAASTQQAYLDAANQAAGITGGYTGEMADTAQAEDARLTEQLRGLGSAQRPDAGQVPALANVSYALGAGNTAEPGSPLNTLARQGTLAYTAAKAIPQGFLGYGQQQAAGVLGKAQQDAASYNLDIGKLLATRGKLTSDYAATLTSQASDQQKFLMSARAQQMGVLKDLSSMVATDNKGKIAVQAAQIAAWKAGQSAVATHNAIVKAQNAFNITRLNIMEKVRHNQITEDQASQRIQQADLARQQAQNIAYQNHIDRVSSMQISRVNAQTAIDNSRGWWFAKDKNGKPIGLPQPTANHRIVWDSGVVGKGMWRSVLIHPAKGAGVGSVGKGLTAIQKALDNGNLIHGTPAATYQDRKGKPQITGWDQSLNNGLGGYSDGTGKLFYDAGGRPALGYNDLVNVLFNKAGGKVSIARIQKIVNHEFADPKIASAFNLTADQSKNPAYINSIALGVPGPDAAVIAPKPSVSQTSQITPSQGPLWNQTRDPIDPGAALVSNTARTKSGRWVDLNTRHYVSGPATEINGSISFPSSWAGAWQQSGVVRPAWDWLSGLAGSRSGGGTPSPLSTQSPGFTGLPTVTPSTGSSYLDELIRQQRGG